MEEDGRRTLEGSSFPLTCKVGYFQLLPSYCRPPCPSITFPRYLAPTLKYSNHRLYYVLPIPSIQAKMAAKYSLPPLPYAYDALEPVISKQIMEIHHQKHHQTYITNLNAALASQASALQANDVPTLISLQQKIKFNGGGHINHSLFWKNLTPPGSIESKIDSAAPTLKAAIEERWGSVKEFTEAFNSTLLSIQGSGWGWLVSSGPRGKLDIITTKDQDPVTGNTPVFGVDMWEHAYYLQYQNNKASYVEGIWKVINWVTAEDRYKNGVQGPSILKL